MVGLLTFLVCILISIFSLVNPNNISAQNVALSDPLNLAPIIINCDNPSLTFNVGGLDPQITYSLEIECDNCPTAGNPESIHTTTGDPIYTYVQMFNPDGQCSNSGLARPSDTYHVNLRWRDLNGNNQSIPSVPEYFALSSYGCTLTAPVPFIAGQPQTVTLSDAAPSTLYGVANFPLLSCTYPTETTTNPSGNSSININCDPDITGSHQIVATSTDPSILDRCWTTYDVGLAGTPPPESCTGETTGRAGVCYANGSPSCRPPSLFDGQDGCPAYHECCVPGARSGGSGFCQGLLTQLPGSCYFLRCPPDRFADGFYPLPGIDCDVFATHCCIPNNIAQDLIPRPALIPFCPNGIDTAIGCIPVNSNTAFVSFMLRWSIGVAGGISFLGIIFAGFLVLTSGGSKERLKLGKELLTSSLGGLLLIIFSVYLLDLIGIRILRLPGL